MVVSATMQKLTRTLKLQPILFIVLVGVFGLFACTVRDPIEVIITPTPQPITPTVIPTLEAEAVEEATSTSTETQPTTTPVPTETVPETPTLSPEPVEPDEIQPTREFGPILPPDYRLQTQPPPTAEPVIPTVTPLPEIETATPTITVTPGPSPTPVPRLNPDLMGLQIYSNMAFEQFGEAISLAEVTNVGWLKIQVNWAFIQSEGPNTFGEQFQLFERQVEAAARPGFRVLLSIAKAPDWARSDRQESGPPDNPQDLANFISFMLNDTKIGGVIDAIEIWNEPNLIREWRGTLPFNGAGYMQLFGPAYDAIRAYSPTMTIVTAGLAPTSHPTAAVDDRLYLQQMYDAGLANYDDVIIGVHPYGWANPPDARCCPNPGQGWDDNPRFFFLDTLEDTYAIMQRNNHNTTMWATEFGWATWDGVGSEPPEPWVGWNSAQDQANYAMRAFEMAQRELPYLDVMFLWNLNFANLITVEQRQEITGYSIINPAVFPRERPLYWMLAQATRDENNNNNGS